MTGREQYEICYTLDAMAAEVRILFKPKPGSGRSPQSARLRYEDAAQLSKDLRRLPIWERDTRAD